MPEDYISNMENMLSTILFVGFKVIVIILAILLILSLIMLAIGCLIKSQKIKSKFLLVVPSLLIGSIFFLSLRYIFVHFRHLIYNNIVHSFTIKPLQNRKGVMKL